MNLRELPLEQPQLTFTRFGIGVLCLVLGASGGMSAGTILESRYVGIAGLVIGGALGFFIGWTYLGVMLDSYGNRSYLSLVEKMSVPELRRHIAIPMWNTAHDILLVELANRGEDVGAFLPQVLRALQVDYGPDRIWGWEILRNVYPDVAKQIQDYNPRDPLKVCEQKLVKFRSSKTLQ
jgi:hypothetical protein